MQNSENIICPADIGATMLTKESVNQCSVIHPLFRAHQVLYIYKEWRLSASDCPKNIPVSINKIVSIISIGC